MPSTSQKPEGEPASSKGKEAVGPSRIAGSISKSILRMKLNPKPDDARRATNALQAKLAGQVKDRTVCSGLRDIGVEPAVLDSVLPPAGDVHLDAMGDECRDLLYKTLYLKRRSLLESYGEF